MLKQVFALLLLAAFSLHAGDVASSTQNRDFQEECHKPKIFESHHSHHSHRPKVFDNLIVNDSLRAGNVLITGNEVVGGSVAVEGSVSASSFITPTGPLFIGLRNYAVFSNQVLVPGDGTIIPWSPSSNNTSSAGISVDAFGNITLPTSGIFLVQYTVRVTRSPFNGTNSVVAQLQQTVGGVPTSITQAAINSNASVDELSNGVPQSQPQLTGYALVTVTSGSNNGLSLAVTFNGGNISMPAASGLDANAQISILQLN